jgi:ribosomal protein L20
LSRHFRRTVEAIPQVLADIAMHEAEAFSAIIAQAKGALEKKAA